ncbi:MAG: hypothetical protein ACRDU9_11450 [Acidimicrobiia bacterium]
MSIRLILAGMLSTSLAAGGLTVAADSGTSATAEAGVSSNIFAVADAGQVTLETDGSTLTVASIDAAAGWSAELEAQTETEAEIAFTSDSSGLRFRAELEDGQIETELEVMPPVGAEVEADTAVEARSEADAEAKVASEAEVDSKAEAEAAADADAGTDTDADAETETDTDADTQVKADVSVRVDVKAGADGQIALGLDG